MQKEDAMVWEVGKSHESELPDYPELGETSKTELMAVELECKICT